MVSLSDTVSVSHDLCANYQPNKSECDNYNERSEGRLMKLLRMLTFASRRKDISIPRNVADCRDVSWHAQSYQHLHLPLGSGTKCRLHESMSTDCKQRQQNEINKILLKQMTAALRGKRLHPNEDFCLFLMLLKRLEKGLLAV